MRLRDDPAGRLRREALHARLVHGHGDWIRNPHRTPNSKTTTMMTPAQRELVSQLELPRSLANRRKGYTYTCGEDFVLKHGKWYEGPWSKRWPQGPPKSCYGWSLGLATMHSPLRYVEGYALAATCGGIAFPHAWNTNAQGRLIDAVWCNTGLAYLGVEFSVERADDAMWNGNQCILDDFERRWPLFREPWTGEDYTLQWPPSERLEAMRERNPVKAGRILSRLALTAEL